MPEESVCGRHPPSGGFEGVVTVADLAMRVLGLDEEQDALVRRDEGSWLVDAMMNFDDFACAVGLRGAANRAHDTVAGFVVARLGRLPRGADRVEALANDLQAFRPRNG